MRTTARFLVVLGLAAALLTPNSAAAQPAGLTVGYDAPEITFDLPPEWQHIEAQAPIRLVGSQQVARFESQPEHSQNVTVSTEVLPASLRSAPAMDVVAQHFAGAASFRRPSGRWEHFVQSSRTIGQVVYPTMSFDGSFSNGAHAFDGLYLDLIPADFAERHRFYSFVWIDIHTPGVPPRDLAEFDAIIASARVRSLGSVLQTTSFSDAQDGVIYAGASDPGRYDIGYRNGEYEVHILDPQLGQALGGVDPVIFDNVGVAVTAVVADGDASAYIMLACRRRPDAETGYRLSVRPATREFMLDRVDEGAVVTDLVEWQESSAIRTGLESNRLELRCSGITITALINDVEVATVDDATHRQGLVVLSAGASAGSTVHAQFRDFAVTQR